MGHLPRGPPAILKDSWCDQDLPISFGKNAQKYLRELHDKLEVAKTSATSVSGSKRNMLRITIYVARTNTLRWARRY